MAEKEKMTKEYYENLKQMLNSENKEDMTTALMAMEQMDFRSGKLFFMLLYKETEKHLLSLWHTDAPDLTKNIEQLLNNDDTYRNIWNVAREEATADEKEVFANVFGSYTMNLLSEWGFKGLIKDFSIKMILKDEQK